VSILQGLAIEVKDSSEVEIEKDISNEMISCRQIEVEEKFEIFAKMEELEGTETSYL
jgi:hypothetical protein